MRILLHQAFSSLLYLNFNVVTVALPSKKAIYLVLWMCENLRYALHKGHLFPFFRLFLPAEANAVSPGFKWLGQWRKATFQRSKPNHEEVRGTLQGSKSHNAEATVVFWGLTVLFRAEYWGWQNLGPSWLLFFFLSEPEGSEPDLKHFPATDKDPRVRMPGLGWVYLVRGYIY